MTTLFFSKTTIWVTVILCVCESLTKGWMSFYLVPISFVVLPLYAGIQHVALKSAGGRLGVPVRLASLALTGFVLGFYVCMVGFADGDEVLLFGFYSVPGRSPIVSFCGTVTRLAYLMAPTAFLVLAALLVVNDAKTRSVLVEGARGPRGRFLRLWLFAMLAIIAIPLALMRLPARNRVPETAAREGAPMLLSFSATPLCGVRWQVLLASRTRHRFGWKVRCQGRTSQPKRRRRLATASLCRAHSTGR